MSTVTATPARASRTATPAKPPKPFIKGNTQPLLILRPSTVAIGQVVAFKLSGVSPTTAKTMSIRSGSVAYYEPLYRLVIAAPCNVQQSLSAPLPASVQGTIEGTFQDFVVCVPSGRYAPTHSSFRNGGGSQTIQAVEELYSQGAGYQNVGSRGSATLTIKATTLTVTGKSSRTLRLRGSGFEAGEYVYLTYDYGRMLGVLGQVHVRDAGSARAGAAGAFTVDLPVGNGIYGSYSITATGLTSSFSATASP